MNKRQENQPPSVLSLKEIFLYIRDKLSGSEQNAVERKLLDSPFEEEAIEGYAGIGEEDARQDLEYLREAVRQRSGNKSNRNLLIWQVAAALFLVAVFIAGTWLILDSDRALQVAKQQNQVLSDENALLKEELSMQSEALNGAGSGIEDESAQPVDPSSQAIEAPAARIAETAEAPVEPEAGKTEVTAVEQPQPLDAGLADDADAKVAEIDMAGEVAAVEIDASGKRSASPQVPAASVEEVVAAAVADDSEAVAMRRSEAASPQTDFRALAGYVRSSEDDGPIAGVRVSPVGLQAEVHSRLDGSFEVVIPSDHDVNLRLFRAGYAPLTVAVNRRDTLKVVMERDIDGNAQQVIIGTNQPDPPVYDPPVPLGGREAFTEYIKSRMPVSDDRSGLVRIRFEVSKDGSIQNAAILYDQSADSAGQEALRVLTEGPPWYPAEKEGEVIADTVDLRIRY